MTDRTKLLFLTLAILCSGNLVDAADLPPGENVDPKALREAIEDLAATFGDRYPQAEDYLTRLDALEATKDDAALARLQRDALSANPMIAEKPLVFVTRRQYHNNHGTEATMCQTGEINTQSFRGGGAIKTIDFSQGGKVETILNVPQGIARDPEIHFDAQKIVFSMRRNIEDDYHVYEMDADGANLKQLTFGPRVSDIQPIYMPDGRIVFSSTREPKYIPCQRHLMANLFTMDADGLNIRQLGHNTQFEGRASLMPDGRILYTRWEYVDKHYASAYGLWTMNPDGTNQALYYGGYAWQPSAIADARVIPGTGRFIGTYTTVHNLAWGALAVVDRKVGLDGVAPIRRSWPADISRYMSQWDRVERIGAEFDSFMRMPIKYEDPFPLSDPEVANSSGKYFLCSRMIRPNGPMGIFLLDVFGNELLLHAEAPGCFDPMPLVAQRRPPVIPPRIDLSKDHGVFYVQDVYSGQMMDRVARGSVRWLRIVEAPAKLTFPQWNIGDWTPALSADSHHPIAVNWDHYNTKRILGKVPVREDGSAYFKVPADRFVYFQLLDENDQMIHSMRSGTSLQPGEEAGCTGCHDQQQSSPLSIAAGSTMALEGPPSEIEPWYGPARAFSYTAEVQPVLDRHCVGCHDHGKEAPELNLSGDLGSAFNVSYTSLRARSPAFWVPPKPGEKKPLISAVGAGPVRVIGPYSWGSHRSSLVDLLRKGHADVKLDRETLERIVTWIDLNTPYYPTHAAYYADNTFGRCPLDHGQLSRLGQLAASVGDGQVAWARVDSYDVAQLSRLTMTFGSPINFTRPQYSRCLSGFSDKTDPRYREALSIIQAGRQNLQQHPRADMPDFVPCESHRKRLDYHRQRMEIEAANRRGMVERP